MHPFRRPAVFVAACFASLGWGSDAAAQLTQQQAIDLVTAQVINSSPYVSTLAAYSYDAPGPLPAGTTVVEFDGPAGVTLASDAWFFWLDYQPSQWFVHPCALVFVDDQTSVVTVIDCQWFPLIDGTGVYDSFAVRMTSPDLFFGNPSPPPAPVGPTAPGRGVATDGTECAVLVAGPADHPASNADLNLMMNALMAGGTAPSVPMANIHKTKGSKQGLCDVLDGLDGCRKLFFHWTGHGGKGKLYFGDPPDPNETMTYKELRDKLKGTGASNFCVTIEACRSGSGAGTLSGLPGTGVTSTDEDTCAGFTNTGSCFTKAFTTCIQDRAADKDASGKVDYVEAKDWAKTQNAKVNGQNPTGWGIADCPAFSYCTGKVNSQGCVPFVGYTGFPSFSGQEQFLVHGYDVVTQKPGLLFYGTTGPAVIPFFNATLCVQPPLQRTVIVNGGGDPAAPCDGIFTFDFTDWLLSGNDPGLQPGVPIFSQYWYRDPQHPDGTGIGLTNALQAQICD